MPGDLTYTVSLISLTRIDGLEQRVEQRKHISMISAQLEGAYGRSRILSSNVGVACF